MLDESPGLAEVFTNAAVLAAQLTVQRTAKKQLPALASPRKTCTLLKQQALAVQRTPPRAMVVLTVDREFEVGPEQQLCSLEAVQLFQELDLSQFTMSD